jgi:Ca2+/H+ antiporter, TMEM165/GDT1 family
MSSVCGAISEGSRTEPPLRGSPSGERITRREEIMVGIVKTSGSGSRGRDADTRRRLMTVSLFHIGPAMTAAFLASLVEAVEALTIVLAVATVRGWRPAGLGALAGLLLLVLIVAALGPLLDRVPLHLLQLAIGILLLMFGMRWLRKAILRSAGVIPLHDEAMAFATETAELREQARRQQARLDWLAALASFKAVLLEGLEVVFIVIAVSTGRGLLVPASAGALAACLLVAGAGFAVHRPLARVPENTLKFAVGVMLSAFGVFWTGEGLGVAWPGADLAIVAFAALFLAVGSAAVALARRSQAEVLP